MSSTLPKNEGNLTSESFLFDFFFKDNSTIQNSGMRYANCSVSNPLIKLFDVAFVAKLNLPTDTEFGKMNNIGKSSM